MAITDIAMTGSLLGVDEAGYGPNLGPLVVSVTRWETPDDPRHCDLFTLFADVCTRQPADRDDRRLIVADSKAVYSPGRGFDRLERTVLAALGLAGSPVASFRDLWTRVTGSESGSVFPWTLEPWFADRDLSLPTVCDPNDLAEMTRQWRAAAESAGVRCTALMSDIVLTQRFNDLATSFDSKGRALSEISMRLVRRGLHAPPVRSGYESEMSAHAHTLVIGDKHGGRNRYAELLPAAVDEAFIVTREESTGRSRYLAGGIEFRFQTRAEEHFPVALASMMCKYIRELSMQLFNGWWSRQVPELNPTAGYPVDARRFRCDVAAAQNRLGIPDAQFWRSR
jgi:hypothetical protein